MTKVKICGITNLEDALAATEAGADYLGFVLSATSKRIVKPDRVREIATRIKLLEKRPLLIGVFVNEDAPAITRMLRYCKLDLAQLHGEEPASMLVTAESALYGRAFKAIRPRSLNQARAQARRYLSGAPKYGSYPSLLLDAYTPSMRGGTGHLADWDLATSLARDVPQMMLAGGLTPANVAEAIKKVRPFAVDVSSGTEVRPGCKNHQSMRDFIRAVERADYN